MSLFKSAVLSGILAASLTAGCASTVQAQTTLTSVIGSELGRAPTITGDVQRFAFPRSDLKVMVDGVEIQPALALGSWLAFRPMMDGHSWEVMGDLVLTHNEIKGVLEKLVAGGITITALHNHLLRAEPATMYMHVHGHGDPASLARTLKQALASTGTPLGRPSPATAVAMDQQLDRIAVENYMGRTGTPANGGVLQFSIPRQQPIQQGGKPIPNPMGMPTAINFQWGGEGSVAATGDFVLSASEVEPVVAALTRAGIEVTALHNHMLDEEPRTFFMHFWGVGTPEQVAGALKRALDLTASQQRAAE